MSDIDDIRDRIQWLKQGRELERGDIIADLRAAADAEPLAIVAEAYRARADRYERGEHLKGKE